MRLLGGAAYCGEKSCDTRLVDQYHSGLYEEDQKRILESFSRVDTNLRCLVCTIAFGLGIDIPDVRFVVHWGASDNILQYWQEVGRGGRDRAQSWAFMYYTNVDLIHRKADIKELCKSVDDESAVCARSYILDFLSLREMDQDVTQNMKSRPPCPDKCENGCSCESCLCCIMCRKRCPCTEA